MKTGLTVAALLILALGAGSVMARGPETYDRAGAFQKGGSGVEVRDEAPAYSLTGERPARLPCEQSAASPDQPGNRAERTANRDKDVVQLKVNHTHQ